MSSSHRPNFIFRAPTLFAVSTLFAWSVLAPNTIAAELPPFSVTPYDAQKHVEGHGLQFYLPKHLLKLELIYKVVGHSTHDPKSGTYKDEIKAELDDIQVGTIKVRDQAERYFVFVGNGSTFTKESSYALKISEDGFIESSEAAEDDKTLNIVGSFLKLAVTALVLFEPAQDGKLSAADQAKARNLPSAERLHKLVEALQNKIAALESDLTTAFTSAADPKNPVDSDALLKQLTGLRKQLVAAEEEYGKVRRINIRTEVVKFVTLVTPARADGHLSGSAIAGWTWTYQIPLAGDVTNALTAAEAHFKSGPIKGFLDSDITIALTLDGYEETADNPAPADRKFLSQDKKKTLPKHLPCGVIYRTAVLATAKVRVGTDVRYDNPTAYLRFSQLGVVRALQTDFASFTKGTIKFEYHESGGIKLVSSGNTGTAAGALAGLGETALTGVKDFKASRATPTEAEVLAKENSLLQAKIDNIEKTNKLKTLQEANP